MLFRIDFWVVMYDWIKLKYFVIIVNFLCISPVAVTKAIPILCHMSSWHDIKHRDFTHHLNSTSVTQLLHFPVVLRPQNEVPRIGENYSTRDFLVSPCCNISSLSLSLSSLWPLSLNNFLLVKIIAANICVDWRGI